MTGFRSAVKEVLDYIAGLSSCPLKLEAEMGSGMEFCVSFTLDGAKIVTIAYPKEREFVAHCKGFVDGWMVNPGRSTK